MRNSVSLVALELGPLVGVEGVLDGQRVQAELLLDGRQLLLARLVQADPDEVAGLGGELADAARARWAGGRRRSACPGGRRRCRRSRRSR